MSNWLGLPLENFTSIWQAIVGIGIYVLSWALFYLLVNFLQEKIEQLPGHELISKYLFLGNLIVEERKIIISSAIIITWLCLKFWILKTCGTCFQIDYPISRIILGFVFFFGTLAGIVWLYISKK